MKLNTSKTSIPIVLFYYAFFTQLKFCDFFKIHVTPDTQISYGFSARVKVMVQYSVLLEIYILVLLMNDEFILINPLSVDLYISYRPLQSQL